MYSQAPASFRGLVSRIAAGPQGLGGCQRRAVLGPAQVLGREIRKLGFVPPPEWPGSSWVGGLGVSSSQGGVWA